MRRRLTVAIIAIVLVGGAIYLVNRGGDPDPGTDTTSGLQAQEISAGEVEVRIEPVRIDDAGAVFNVALDTHSEDLSADLTLATLTVDGSAWAVDAWSGDGPGGHHREGELSFEPGGPATGTAILTVPGLPEPVNVNWDLDR